MFEGMEAELMPPHGVADCLNDMLSCLRTGHDFKTTTTVGCVCVCIQNKSD